MTTPTIQEYRRANFKQVLADIAQEYDAKPARKLHIKPVKAISGADKGISKPGINFALPEESDFDRVT